MGVAKTTIPQEYMQNLAETLKEKRKNMKNMMVAINHDDCNSPLVAGMIANALASYERKANALELIQSGLKGHSDDNDAGTILEFVHRARLNNGNRRTMGAFLDEAFGGNPDNIPKHLMDIKTCMEVANILDMAEKHIKSVSGINLTDEDTKKYADTPANGSITEFIECRMQTEKEAMERDKEYIMYFMERRDRGIKNEKNFTGDIFDAHEAESRVSALKILKKMISRAETEDGSVGCSFSTAYDITKAELERVNRISDIANERFSELAKSGRFVSTEAMEILLLLHGYKAMSEIYEQMCLYFSVFKEDGKTLDDRPNAY